MFRKIRNAARYLVAGEVIATGEPSYSSGMLSIGGTPISVDIDSFMKKVRLGYPTFWLSNGSNKYTFYKSNGSYEVRGIENEDRME